MKRPRKRFSAGEVRIRVSKEDLDRINWLLEHASISHPSYTVSGIVRTLILREYERLQPKTDH